MDGLRIIDGLDSLWFFCNVLSSTTQQFDHAVQEQPPKPIGKVEESQRNDSLPAQTFGRRCSKCGEFAAELEPQEVQHPVGMEVPIVEITKLEEKRKSRRRRRRRSKRSSLDEKRQILGELDLGFNVNMGSESSSNWLFEETRSGYQMFGNQHYINMKMPPLSDGMAMKEHLKSWAYAVASTVR